MELTPRRHELLSCYLLGLGTLFLYLGYVTQSFMSESVIHAVSEIDPTRISKFAGYYGQAFHYSAFAVSSFFTPTLTNHVSSKWILTVASALFAVYYLGFFYVNNFYFYFSQALMGIGYSLYNNGEGAYLSEHSSRRTIESNTGIETAVGHSSMFVGGIALLCIFYFTSSHHAAAGNPTDHISQLPIPVIYGVLFLLNVISVIIFTLLPTKQYDSIASKSSTVLPSFKTQIHRLMKTIYAPNMLLLIPFFLYMGLIVSFLMAVFPTTLSFNRTHHGDIYIVAIYSIGLGVAEIIGGIFLRPLIKRLQKWGLVFCMMMHFISIAATIAFSAATVPNHATISPTAEPALVLQSSRLTVIIIALLIGLGDFSITMSRAVICQVAVPDSRMEVFSLSRLWQCVSSCVILVLSPHMTLFHWLSALSIFLVLGCSSFVYVAIRTNKSRKITVCDPQATDITTIES